MTLVLRGVLLPDGNGPTDVWIADGRVAAIGPGVGGNDPGLDGQHRVVLPGLADVHLHLDKAYLWDDPLVHGTTRGAAFAAFRGRKAHSDPAEIKERMLRALRLASRHGVTAIRAQVDVDELVGLAAIRVALEVRAECSAWMTLQVVAFPQEGLLSRPEVLPLLRSALAAGADAVGGGAGLNNSIPVLDHLTVVFALAREFDVDVDLHADLGSGPDRPPEHWELQDVARLTRACGWEGRVMIAHLTGMGAMPAEPARELATLLLEHGISVATVPGAELHSATVWRSPPVYDVRQALTNVRLLLESRVNLSMATGHVRDPLNPYGNADPLRDLLLLLGAVSLGEPSIAGVPAIDLISRLPRRALRLPEVGVVEVGQAADFIVLEATHPDMLPRAGEQVRYVLKDDRLVWSTQPGLQGS